MDEEVQVIGHTAGVDLELDRLVDRNFTVEWWRDVERTLPITMVSTQLAVASGTTILFNEGSSGVTLAPDTNRCIIKIEKSVFAEMAPGDWDLKWFFQAMDVGGAVMLIRGRARVV